MSDGILSYDITADGSGFRKEASAVTAEIHRMHSELMSLASIAFGPLVAGLAGVGAAVAGIGIGTKIAAEREKFALAFKYLVGDAEKAKKVFDELKAYSDVTPFKTDEVTASASALLAAGVAAGDLKGEIAVLGNVAAASGASLEQLARIYGEIKGQGKVEERHLDQFVFQGAGEVKAQLARSLGVTTEELRKLQTEGNITFPMLKAALHDLAGETGKYAGTTAEMAGTTMGLWSTLESKVKDLGEELGKAPNDAIKPVFTQLIALAVQLKPMMADVGGSVGGLVSGFDNLLAHASKGGSVVAELGAAIRDMWQTAGEYAGVVFSGLGEVIVGLGKALIQAVTPAGEALGHLFMAALAGLEAGVHRISADIYRMMADIPFIGSENVARLNGRAEIEQGSADNAGVKSDREMKAAGEVWESGKGLATALDTVAGAVVKAEKKMGDAFDQVARNAERRKESRERPLTLAGEDAAASKVNKAISAPLDKKERRALEKKHAVEQKAWLERNARHRINGEALEPELPPLSLPGGETAEDARKKWQHQNQVRKGLGMDPLPAPPGMELPEKKQTFDVHGTANRPGEAAMEIFVKGGQGAGIALIQLAKEALDAGNAIKAKKLTDLAAKSEMPGGAAAAASLEALSKQADKAGDSELADKLIEMAHKAMEAGGKFETAGSHAATGGNSIMSSLTASASALNGGKGAEALPGSFKIHGYDGKKQAQEEARGRQFAKRAWDAEPAGEKAKFGNDPAAWMRQKQAEFADGGGTRKQWDKTMRESPWSIFGGKPQPLNPRALTPEQLNQRANQALRPQGGGGRDPAAQGGGKPRADTADSSTRTLLQQQLAALNGINTKLQQLTVA